jgi:anti-sigma regulatory factor (Ser/Thr protein kinase)
MSGTPDDLAGRGRWVLTVPPEARFASTLRTFVSVTGRRLVLDAERVEDLKLILTEVCNAAAEASRAEALTVVVNEATEGEGASIRCAGAGPAPGGSGVAGFRLRLLRSLAEDLDWSGDGTVVFSI